MAELRMETLSEKALSPAFIFFFKLLYPFALANNPRSKVSAAAGGCVLLRARTLQEIGGFGAFKESIIDDCELARRVKINGGKTWLRLTHSAKSQRQYPSLISFWNMVARTAFTQLGYSIPVLLLTTFLMAAVFWLPVAGVASPSWLVRAQPRSVSFQCAHRICPLSGSTGKLLLGDHTPLRRFAVPFDDVVICHPVLERPTLGMEGA